ncbi:MAG: peptide chain release factor N(5)-glutamine methyltransferase [Thiohalomonadaceae bacterium]
MKVAEALAAGADRLPGADARREAEILLAHVLGHTRTWLYTWPEHALTDDQWTTYQQLLARRVKGEPIAHLIGRREFWSLDLAVSVDTLIPRHETEVLVEQALARIPLDAAWRIADLGTGSGAVALAIASERPGCTIVATDRNAAALAVARDNAARYRFHNVEFREGAWFEPLHGDRFMMIVSNPPYIAADDPHLSQGDVRFEPRSALVGGADGLEDLRLLAAGAGAYLHPGGWLLLEHGFDQGAAVRQLLSAQGFLEVASMRDSLGHERVSLGRRP